ncbi:MAG: hypothetical protein AAF531_00255 [Actinomycetota bacterium]
METESVPVDGTTEKPTLEDAVVATVAYSDVFDMPIGMGDLHRFLIGRAATPEELTAAADALVAAGRLGRDDGLLFLPGRDEVLAVHADRVARAATMWPKAVRWGVRIGRLPNVVAVAVTGGLAVDSVAPHDDADYFIITRPGRLWLTRLLVLVLVRLAERDDIELCPNYIVSESALVMDERTIYVARELAQMVPVTGVDRCREVRTRNRWMFDQLPNATVDGDLSRVVDIGRSGFVKRAAEAVLALPMFGPLERWEMTRKTKKLATVRSRRPEVGAPDESSFSPDVCKGHMVGNAGGIEVAWRERIDR